MNILTFDIEDWFHILDYEGTLSSCKWSSLESRVEYITEIILNKLASANKCATFFVLGWVAEQFPHLIKKISDAGHEIGSHTFSHELIYRQQRQDFERDLVRSLDVIEGITQKKLISFRAPGFSINRHSIWAFDTLIKHGFIYDASIFPARRSHGGIHDLKVSEPFLIKTDSGFIKEFPMTYYSCLGKKIVFSGGGYLRLTPRPVINYLLSSRRYDMIYLHPRDFDVDQPKIEDLNLVRHFKYYVNISKSWKKLDDILKMPIDTISSYGEKIDWSLASTINCGSVND